MALQNYLIFGTSIVADEGGFFSAVARAHAEHHRPRCLCNEAKPAMYVARWGETYLLKRMPLTGSSHSHDCPSHDLPVLSTFETNGSDRESPAAQTTIWPAFAMSKRDVRDSGGHRARVPRANNERPRLSLLGLIHHLWDRAELTRWHPGFANKRNWAVVRKLLLSAAAGEVLAGKALRDRLFVPKTFQVQRRDANVERLLAQWESRTRSCGHPLMLVAGELKEIQQAGMGAIVTIKHLPQKSFQLSEAMYSDLCRRFGRELSERANSQNRRIVVIATFLLETNGIAHINEVSLMATNWDWIPLGDSFENELIDQLVRDQRHFRKRLRPYGAPTGRTPTAELLDTARRFSPLFIKVSKQEEPERQAPERACWVWDTHEAAIPPFPPSTRRRIAYPRKPEAVRS